MQGVVINQVENILTLDVKTNYVFDQYEEVEVTSKKVTFIEELRGLYWELMDWMITEKHHFELPEAEKWFRQNENQKLAKDKLYTLSRFIVGWVEVSYDKTGNQQINAKSTDHKSITQQQYSELYENTYNYFARYIDMTGFNIQHGKAREKMGKYY